MRRAARGLCVVLLLVGVLAAGCRAVVDRRVPVEETVYAIFLPRSVWR